jgi:hypothetical protein
MQDPSQPPADSLQQDIRHVTHPRRRALQIRVVKCRERISRRSFGSKTDNTQYVLCLGLAVASPIWYCGSILLATKRAWVAQCVLVSLHSSSDGTFKFERPCIIATQIMSP